MENNFINTSRTNSNIIRAVITIGNRLRPISVECCDGTDVNSSAYGSAGTDGSVYLATKLTSVHSHRKFGTGSDQGAFSGGAFVSLTANKTLELYFIGTSDATNLTVGDCSFYMKRVQ